MTKVFCANSSYLAQGPGETRPLVNKECQAISNFSAKPFSEGSDTGIKNESNYIYRTTAATTTQLLHNTNATTTTCYYYWLPSPKPVLSFSLPRASPRPQRDPISQVASANYVLPVHCMAATRMQNRTHFKMCTGVLLRAIISVCLHQAQVGVLLQDIRQRRQCSSEKVHAVSTHIAFRVALCLNPLL